MALPSLRYPAQRAARPTKWAQDWRKRWFRQVGTVCEYFDSGELIALYSDARDPAARLALQHELEARPNGPAQVLAACRKVSSEWNRRVADSRHGGEAR